MPTILYHFLLETLALPLSDKIQRDQQLLGLTLHLEIFVTVGRMVKGK